MKQEQFLHVLDRDEAERRFRAALGDLRPRGVEVVALVDALGRVLADDIASPVDVPGFDRSNVDGWAVRAADTFGASEQTPRSLRRTADVVRMGEMPAGAVEPGLAMPIPTGGVVPRGADAVVMVEHTVLDGGEVLVSKPVTPGRAVTYAGTDVAQGEVVLRGGETLTSRETGIVAAMGIAEVKVYRRPRVAIFSTGDEIVAPGQPLRAGQIYDSNAVILADAVRECGGEPLLLGIVADDLEAVRATLRRALAEADVVLLSGGTSKGPGDLNVRALAEVLEPPGVLAHGVALKPGKPLCLAVSGSTAVVVLPGFPTSAIFTFHEFVAPVVRALSGNSSERLPHTRARLPVKMTSDPGRTEYVLVRLVEGLDGAPVAYPIGKGSGSVTTWSQADGFFVIPARVERLDEGELVEVSAVGGGPPRPVDLVVIGSHCLGVDVLLGELRRRGLSSKQVAVGSEGGLAAVRRGECDVAGVHLFHRATGSYNAPFVTAGIELLSGYGRMQGVVHRPDDPRFTGKTAQGAVRDAIASAEMVMINRNRGSGTRALYDGLLGDARPPGHAVEASSHHAIAAAVAQGRADWGIAIDVVARARGLGFLPLAEERFDFLISTARRHRPGVKAFVDVLSDPQVRARLGARGFLV
jgi:putative molybdopterin biosynthesis protein